jgi:hypothetical protein
MLQSQLLGRGTPRQEIADRSSPLFKARELLCSILPPEAREEFLLQDAFHYRGKRASYRICRSSQTEIYWNGHLGGNACLQLTVPTPSYDRMIAEYLILNTDETLYWSKANILPSKRLAYSLPELMLSALNIILLINLVVDHLI